MPEQRPVTIYHEYTGTTQASDSVEIRARVGGYPASIHFEDGGTIAEGQLPSSVWRRGYSPTVATPRSLGTALFGGRIAAMRLAVFFVPVSFVVLERIRPRRSRQGNRPLTGIS